MDHHGRPEELTDQLHPTHYPCQTYQPLWTEGAHSKCGRAGMCELADALTTQDKTAASKSLDRGA